MVAATSTLPPSPVGTEARRVPSTAHEWRLLSVVAHRDPRTVKAAYRGAATPMAAAAVAAAAAQLGFAAPPPPQPKIDTDSPGSSAPRGIVNEGAGTTGR